LEPIVNRTLSLAFIAYLGWAAPARAADTAQPKDVPLTRPDMKKALDDLKKRQPRLPLPPLTEKEKADGKRAGGNGRMRAYYLPKELHGQFPRGSDDAMTLDHKTKTMFFWLVSRANNCMY
jgi:hypothetical protein